MLHNFEWNEANSDSIKDLHGSLVRLLAHGPDRAPELIGTGFIVGAYGNHAVAFSAAHNFYEGIQKIQNPDPIHHGSTLREFLPGFDKISVDRKILRAVYRVNDWVEACVIDEVYWDKKTDVAIFTLACQDLNDKSVFDRYLKIDQVSPNVGDTVCMLGYGNMGVGQFTKNGPREAFQIRSQLVLRSGRIKAVHPKGHILCKGPCIETTIPVFGGMSGGPVFLEPEAPGENIVPFGLISHDPDVGEDEKYDRSRPGSSIASLLPVSIKNETGDARDILIRLADFGLARNAEFDGQKNSSLCPLGC